MQLYLREALDNLAGDGLSPIGFAAGGELGAVLILDAEMAGTDADFLRSVGSLFVGLGAMAVFLVGRGHVGFVVGSTGPKTDNVAAFPRLADLDAEAAQVAQAVRSVE